MTIKKNFSPIGVTTYLLSLAVFSAVTHYLLRNASLNDYPAHIEFIEGILTNGSLGNDLPHFLYHLLVILFYSILPFLSINQVAYYVVPSLCITFLGLILYFILKIRAKFDQSNLSEFSLLFFLFTLLVASPITFTTYPNIYLGYLYINVYHNPTVTLIKPLSLVLFYAVTFFLHEFSRDRHVPNYFSRKLSILIFIVTMLSLLGKPSYVICLLPAVFLSCLVKLLNSVKRIDSLKLFKEFIVCLFFPALVVLLLQYLFTYGDASSTDSSIKFSPFLVIARYVDYDYSLMFRLFILSILFPLTVYFLYFPKARFSPKLNFAWLVFWVSSLYYYTLVETGPRMGHGNFGWGVQVALFILFFESLIFLLNVNEDKTLRYKLNSRRLRFYTCLFIYALHISSGIIFSVAALSYYTK